MQSPLSYRAFAFSVAWTLALLLLGSIVHATESSLACPDWPTCFGTMMPEMVGGVFWEHLHRLVAGGLILVFGAAAWIATRRLEARWIRAACWGGLSLLLVQALFGGLTVIYRLPDAVSTTHLGLAFLFLGLTVVLAAATSPRWAVRESIPAPARSLLRLGGGCVALLVFLQSVLGAVVRHTDSGMACGHGILCNGGVVPGAWSPLVALHWSHRAFGLALAVAVFAMAWRLFEGGAPGWVRRAVSLAVVLVAIQVILGFVSAYTILAVTPVSLHTLVAASLLATCTLLASWGWIEGAEAEARSATEAPESPSTAGV